MESHAEEAAAVNTASQKEVEYESLTRTYNNQELEIIFPCEGELLLYIPHHWSNYS